VKKRLSPDSLGARLYKNRHFYVLMLPFFLIFFVFTVWPVLMTIGLSFTSYNVFEAPKFVGWDNYINLFVNDDVFGIAMKNTWVFALITGPLGFFLSLFFAWIINEMPRGVREMMTLIFYAPAIVGANYTIWLIIFDGDIYGYLNSLLLNLHLIREPILWLKDPDYMLVSVVVVQLWASLGTSFLTMRAGFNTVDRSLLEAGLVDGIRNRYQEFWYITLPELKPQLMFGAVMSITGSFGMGDMLTGVFGFPSSNYALHTLVHHLQDYGNVRFEMGYACAIAVLLFILMVGANQIVQRLLRKVGD